MTTPEQDNEKGRRAVKVFEVSVQDQGIDKPPYPFELKFGRKDGGAPVVRQFEALGEVGARGALATAALIRITKDNEQQVDPNALMGFFSAVMTDEQFLELHSLVFSKELTVPMPTLLGLWTWLVEEYTGRPTQQLSISPGSS